MIPENEMLRISRSLLEKSRTKSVNWFKTNDNTYAVRISPSTRISVTYSSPSMASDFLMMIVMSNGNVVGQFAADDGTPEFDILKSLYDEADRKVTKWDIALDEINRALEGDDDIGRTDADFLGDDIPF